ncbi:MAG TPA: substrate-binding domain-containing protein [Burkholderiales bacterium]|nr:substrate-binding domain-containing protein [Burkholderiales bacterium]
MATVRVLSAGAARAVVERVAMAFERDGDEIRPDFGAVGTIRARILAGEAADVIVLTAAMIEELTASGHVAAGSRSELGRVGTGVAVRAGTPLPDVSTARALRGNLLAAERVVCPDPAVATAGKVVMRMLERLGVSEQVGPRLRFFPNGHAAMVWLAASRGALEMGVTQITEILPVAGVTYAGPLPEALQMKTVYAAGVAQRAANPEGAREFIRRLSGPAAREMLARAGYELD